MGFVVVVYIMFCIGISAIGALLEPFWTDNGQCINLTDFVPGGQYGTIHCSDLTGCGYGLNAESWDYQACQQDISPMATNNSNLNMFAPNWIWNYTWLEYHCHKRFNLDIKSVYNRRHWMRDSFGLNREYYWNNNVLPYITSNIIFSNGMQDGWHAGGQLTNFTNSDSLIAIVMQNGAHHTDLAAYSEYDTDDVLNARKMELELISKWVKETKIKKRVLKKSTKFYTVTP